MPFLKQILRAPYLWFQRYFRGFILFGVIVYFAYFFLSTANGLVEGLSSGGRLIWVSVLIFVVFSVIQARDLLRFFRQPNQRINKLVKPIVYGVFYLQLVLIAFIAIYPAFGLDDAITRWIDTNVSGGPILPWDQISSFNLLQWVFAIILTVIIAGYMVLSSAIYACALFCLLMVGKLGLGVTLALLFNNLVNGRGFQIEGVLNAIAELSTGGLGEWLALTLSFVWFIVSFFIFRYQPGEVYDVL